MRVERIDEYRWRVPREGGMRTEGLIFADAELMRDLEGDQSIQQVANVAHLPGIVGPSIAMPDIHWGYGFPIGGVAAFDEAEGVISPGGVGYDINCGVRLLVAPLGVADVRPRLAELMDRLFATIPSGVGASRSDVQLQRRDLERVLRHGAAWAVEQGYGFPADLAAIEANGELPGADPDAVSERAKQRGKGQLGTVGSGNHFVEVGYVAETFDPAAAQRLGLEPRRLPGVRRLARRDDQGRRQARDRASGPPVVLRPAVLSRSKDLFGRDERGGQLRLRKPSADGALRPPGARHGVRARRRGADAARVRRMPQ